MKNLIGKKELIIFVCSFIVGWGIYTVQQNHHTDVPHYNHSQVK